jgi:tetratricopeptide (TPR) repeat protein
VRRATTAVCVALCIGVPASAKAQNVAQYLALAREYAAGQGTDAMMQLATWSRPDITAAGKAAAVTATVRDLMALAMLHTDLANTIIDRQREAADFHVTRAQEILAVARGDAATTARLDNERVRQFSRSWFRFVIGMYTSCNRVGDAARFTHFGFLASPEDPRFYVARGVLIEVRTLTFVPKPATLALAARRREQTEESLKAAATNFLHALSVDPRNAEAHLHLGWVRSLLEDKRARTNLDAALENATNDTVRYLAHLFLGGIAERENRLPDALREYEAVRSLGAGYQTPYAALSRVADALGDAYRARELAMVGLQLKKSEDDPWWDLRIGFDRESLNWLRAEARKP